MGGKLGVFSATVLVHLEMRRHGPGMVRVMAGIHKRLYRRAEQRAKKKARKIKQRCLTCDHERCVCNRGSEDTNPYASTWWSFIHRETVKQPRHRDGKLFRRRFRVPYTMFRRLVSMWRERQGGGTDLDEDGLRKTDAIGRPCHPLELKILAALRVLGRG